MSHKNEVEAAENETGAVTETESAAPEPERLSEQEYLRSIRINSPEHIRPDRGYPGHRPERRGHGDQAATRLRRAGAWSIWRGEGGERR